MIYRVVERYMNGGTGSVGGGKFHERHAIVTSYDPDKYLAKVTLMPEGQETGWLPIETGHIGSNYGFAVGLQPGNGKDSGDQVIVRLQEGDLESGKIVQRVHSDNDKPPKVESGEMVMWAKFKKSTGKSGLGDDATGSDPDDNDQADGGQGGSGQQFYFKKDGSVTITDGNGASIVFDGKGGIVIKGKTLQADIDGVMTLIAGGDAGFKGGGNAQITAGNIAGMNGALVNIQGGGSVSDKSVSPSSGGQNFPPTTFTP